MFTVGTGFSWAPILDWALTTPSLFYCSLMCPLYVPCTIREAFWQRPTLFPLGMLGVSQPLPLPLVGLGRPELGSPLSILLPKAGLSWSTGVIRGLGASACLLGKGPLSILRKGLLWLGWRSLGSGIPT